MHSLIYVSASQDDALKTLEELKNEGYSDEQVNLINRDNIVNNHLYISHEKKIETLETAVCIAIGIVVGIMLASGAIHVPNVNFHSFESKVTAVCLGIVAGIFSGAFLAGITFQVLAWLHNNKYQHLLQNGKFLIFVNGNPDEITHAEKIAHNEAGLHWQYS